MSNKSTIKGISDSAKNDSTIALSAKYGYDKENEKKNIFKGYNPKTLLSSGRQVNITGITDENNFKIAVEKLNNPKYEFYINYRCQKIYEYKENEYIRIIAYIDNIFCDLYCRCKKYTQEYYDLCYIAFSFCKLSNSIYDDLFIQKNNYCILKNGKYIFDSYSINLNFKNPYRFLTKLNDIQFKEYLTKNKKINQGLSNPYLDNGFEKIFNKIENYKNSNINDIAGIPIEIISDYENEVYENE